jgi:putative oxidoreductase
MDVVFVVGRVLLVQMFIMGGLLFHLGQRRAATEAAKSMGVPLATIGVPLTGTANIVGGLMVVLGVWGDVGALALALNAFLFANFMHPFWKMDGDQQDEELQHFLKDMTICGGLIVLFWVFNQVGSAAPLTLTDPLFGPF